MNPKSRNKLTGMVLLLLGVTAAVAFVYLWYHPPFRLNPYQGGALMVSEDGDVFGPTNKPGAGYLMQPGLTYLFSTRYESPGVYYLWDFPTASKLISKNASLSDAPTFIHRSKRRSRETNRSRLPE